MTSTTIHFGPPGTGKTRLLVERARSAIAAGTDPERIAFVAFTRRAAVEARARGAADLGLDPDQLKHWRTLHSTAARQLGGSHVGLLEPRHWAELGAALSLRFGELDETGEPASLVSERGTRLRHLEGLARATRRPLRETWERSEREVPWEELDRFNRTLTEYKADTGRLDYSDLLDEAPGDLPVDLVLLDEAQDLTPAQWDYFHRAFSGAAAAHVAGDDDQALFDWAGGDVRRFLDLPGEREVLGQSYRLPRAVHDRACVISDRIRVRHAKWWRARDADGAVLDAPYPDSVPVWDGEWLLLARTRDLLDHWEQVCRDAGVPYIKLGQPSIRPSEAVAIRAWETLRRGGVVEGTALGAALDLSFEDRPFEPVAGTNYGWAAMGMSTCPGWRLFMTKIPPARRRYYEACLRRSPRALTDPPRVALSTIHGAKGGEADRVAILQDVTPRVEAGLYRDPDAEHRVWFVAATRAREELHLVRPLTERSYRI